MLQFSTHMELSRSMAAILEMPQYVAYQKNVVYAFIKLSAKSHSFKILCTMDGLSCPTNWLSRYNTARGEYDMSTDGQDGWHANWKQDKVTDSVTYCSTFRTHIFASPQMARPTGSKGALH